jgi:TolB protein
VPDARPADLRAVSPFDEERRKIAAWLSFISERDGDLEVYLIHPSGEHERRLTRRPGGDYNGPASPDGSELLVISVQESASGDRQSLHSLALRGLLLQGGSAAQKMGGDIPVPRPLGPPRLVVRHPAWTPDGRFVIFEGDSSFYRDLFRIRRDGGELKPLTNNREGNFEPAISPRGDFLYFVSSRDRVAELYRARLDGGEPTRLTHTERDEWSPRVSADGALVVFASDREGADRLYLARADGKDARRVTDSSLDPDLVEESPSFSPVGLRLAYVLRKRGGGASLQVLDVKSGARYRIGAELDGEPGEPAWSPDARHLAFTVRRGRDIQIYLARADGSELGRVTSSAGPNWNPRFIAAPAHAKGAADRIPVDTSP